MASKAPGTLDGKRAPLIGELGVLLRGYFVQGGKRRIEPEGAKRARDTEYRYPHVGCVGKWYMLSFPSRLLRDFSTSPTLLRHYCEKYAASTCIYMRQGQVQS